MSDSSDMKVFIDYPNTETWQGHLHRNFVSAISPLCPSAKVLEFLILPTINKYLQPAPNQHGFRPNHSTTSALLQLTTDITMVFNQGNPPDRTICVAVDLSAAFDTVCHNNLMSMINRSLLPPDTACCISCYLTGRQDFRGVKSTSKKVNTGVPQGSKLYPSLCSFYIVDMPRPTEPVKRFYYADELTVWTTGVKLPDLDDSTKCYLEEITMYMNDNSLLISATKSTVTLFRPGTHQAKPHQRILTEDTQLRWSIPKDIRSLPRHLSSIQQAQRLRSRECIQ